MGSGPLSDTELREWASARYGAAAVTQFPADAVTAILRRLHDNVNSVEQHGHGVGAEGAVPYDDFMADLNERLRAAGHPALPILADHRQAV